MKNRNLRGIQSRFLFVFIVSILGAALLIIIFQLSLSRIMTMNNDALAKLEKEYAGYYFATFLVLTTMIFFMGSRFIIKRIEKIMRYVVEVKNGNFNSNLDVEGKDEIGDLSSGIKEMVDSLQDYMARQKRSEESKNEMISNISHDLRTPLTSLSGYIELLKSNRNDSVASDAYLEIIDMKCAVLKDQINELLDTCNLNNHALKLRLEKISIKGLIEQVMIDFIPQLEQEGIDFFIESNDKLFVTVDIQLFIRVLQNIIGNAISYGKSGKIIRIEAFSSNCEVVIRVTNYGEAISKEDMPYIFERFFRGDKSRNSNTGGKGMGLAVSKSIVELHQGKIDVTSDELKTVFEIRLPENLK